MLIPSFQVDLTRQHIMSSYYKKVQAVRNQKILFDKLRQMRHPVGFIMRPVDYTKMYSESFKEYFIYKVLGDSGPVLSNGKTPWGLDVKAIERSKQTSDRGLEMPNDWEYPVHLTELEAWLEKDYGHLTEAEDYQYLANILLASDVTESQPSIQVNKARALHWLQVKIDASASISAAAPNAAPYGVIPGVVIPGTVMPEVVTPAGVIPALVMPDVFIPDIVTPEVVIPEVVTPTNTHELGLEWNIPATQFVEMALGLITSGAVKVPNRVGRDATIEMLAKALGFTLGSPVRVIINNIRTQRNEDRPAPLLARMLSEFLGYIKKEKE